jgi:hypothetical protein
MTAAAGERGTVGREARDQLVTGPSVVWAAVAAAFRAQRQSSRRRTRVLSLSANRQGRRGAGAGAALG